MITRPDPMPPGEWKALLAASLDQVEPPEDGDEHLDPEGSALPPDEDLGAIEDETDRIAAERFADARYLARAETAELAGASAASAARKRGPRGPGLPGSASQISGVSGGPAGGFGAGQCLDLAPGSAALHAFIETAVDSGRLGAASEDEIIGLITAADRTGPDRGGTGPPGTTSTGFTFTPDGAGPPGRYGTWRFTTGVPGQPAWIITIDPISAGPCDHRYQAKGHDPGVTLRHLTEVRYATCTGPACRKPTWSRTGCPGTASVCPQ